MAIPQHVKLMILSMLGMLLTVISIHMRQRKGVSFGNGDPTALGNARFSRTSRVARRFLQIPPLQISFMLASLFRQMRATLVEIITQRDTISEFYVKPRSLEWWNRYVMAIRGDEAYFQEVFRLPLQLFQDLSDLLREELQQGDIPASLTQVSGRLIPVQKQVAIALLRLASGARLIEIGEHFGLAKSTVSKIVHKFVDALTSYQSRFIYLPRNATQATRVKRGFFLQRGFPNCCGALDISHVNMELPQYENRCAWYDRNKNYFMSVQCVVDMNLRFMDVFAGFPGSVNDKRILRNSAFKRCVDSGAYLSGDSFVDGNFSIREYIVADGGFTLQDWCMIPYVLPAMEAQRQFNFLLSSTRIVVERAFGRLKQVWRYCHGKIICPDPTRLSQTILACCIMHNILIGMDMEEDMDEGDLNPCPARMVPRRNALVLRTPWLNTFVEHRFCTRIFFLGFLIAVWCLAWRLCNLGFSMETLQSGLMETPCKFCVFLYTSVYILVLSTYLILNEDNVMVLLYEVQI